jgi:hypothetical protein
VGGSTGLGVSDFRFNRMISNSSSPSRYDNSSMPCFALTTRTISQIPKAIGIPRTAKTIIGISASINFLAPAQRVCILQLASSW